jgi:hypothetical protein
MKNLKRYGPCTNGTVFRGMHQIDNGGWVKFSDIKELLQTAHNKPSDASCPQCGSELIVYQETYCSSSECFYAIDNGQPAHVG